MHSIEFYTFEDEVWYRCEDGTHAKLDEMSRDIVKWMIEKLEEFYPTAYVALGKEFKACKANIPYFEFRIAFRFCKCNFGGIDNVKDIDGNGRFHFERVVCPLRGECRHEGIVCNPPFNAKISPAEMRVLELIWRKMKTSDIANKLSLAERTIQNHTYNAYTRIGVREKAEFIAYAHTNKLFKEDI